ncbi:MAG: dihydrodipicolinate synthase family protein [Puniceicoccaceae bacterium]|nr:MAG: dihydrodipicolinate synthase family protein [Puniceicoccaceae bacterium]
MDSLPPAPTSRRDWQQRLFPEGLPRLWCPLLTPFAAPRVVDPARLDAHLRFLAPSVRGFLLPGSTGEGWEMTDSEAGRLLDHALDLAPMLGFRVLIGVLKTDAAEARRSIDRWIRRLRRRTGCRENLGALVRARVAGFTVCPPKGGGLAQADLVAALDPILASGLPIALYQLPQVTENELTPATVQSLAGRFPNFILFKDTSGGDRVALSGRDFGGVFLVRGAEGSYPKWPRAAGGPYDGFLLSTANAFGRPYARLLDLLDRGRGEEARRLTARLEAVVDGIFAAAAPLSGANVFTRANKALDHWMAHGPAGTAAPAPLLRSGQALPESLLATARDLLRAHRLFPRSGYLS